MANPRPFRGQSITTASFWDAFAELSATEQDQARRAHQAWLANTGQPGLKFKKIHAARPVYSVRINRNIRAVGVMKDADIIWFWIGPHDEYEALIKSL